MEINSLLLYPDEELCCDSVDSSEFGSSVKSDDYFENKQSSLEMWYDSFFKDCSEGGFQSIFPNVSFVEAEDEMDAVLSQAVREYPLLSPEYLQEKRAQNAERKQRRNPNGPSTSSVVHTATHTPNKEEREMKKLISSRLSLHPSNSPSSCHSEKELPQNWMNFLCQEYTRGILLPCPPETGNRAFFVEKHKNLFCSHTPDGKLDFRVLYDHNTSTGWVFPVTVDESVLSTLKAMYPTWRPITWDDVEVATSKKKKDSNVQGTTTNEHVHHYSSALTACNDSSMVAATGGATATNNDSGRESDPLPSSPLEVVTLPMMHKWACEVQESPERFLRALEAAGGLEEAIFVCVDVEASHSVKSGVTFPLEISCVPFTFSRKHHNFAPLLQRVEKKFQSQSRTNKTKEGEENSTISLHDSIMVQEESDVIPSTQTASRSRSSDPHREKSTWEANICPAESNNNKMGMLKGEFHCFIYPGFPEPAYYKEAHFTSLNLHGIPFDASFLRKDYITIRKELDVFFQNPSCIFLAKGGVLSPPVADVQGIRFVYAAAAAIEEEIDEETGVQKEMPIKEGRDGDSHSTSLVSTPLYVDQMRLFNSMMVEEIVSQMFCDDSSPTDDRPYQLPHHWGDADTPTKTEEVVKGEGEKKIENNMKEVTAEKEENRDVFVRYLECWYHHKVKKVGCCNSSDCMIFHCARRDAWCLAKNAEKCVYEAILRKEKRKKK